MDERAHTALKDAALFLNCPVLMFKHRDVASFGAALARCGVGARPLVLTDGMFSHDGSVAPLSEYLKLLPRDGLLLVDDAHGAGVLGNTGGGAVELDGMSRQRVVQCVTLSKAFGIWWSDSLFGKIAGATGVESGVCWKHAVAIAFGERRAGSVGGVG
jgi:7-keto-8-aminopelargonate synthetase-like enzyme